MRIFWRIRNKDGKAVCERASLIECQRLLKRYTDPARFPGWSSGPYRIFRVTRRSKGTPTSEQMTNAARHHALAIVLGYNELAKLGTTLGEKVYYRLARDQGMQAFVAAGGNADVFAKEDGIATIELPGGPPHVVFVKRDIELMRVCVAEHDARATPDQCIEEAESED